MGGMITYMLLCLCGPGSLGAAVAIKELIADSTLEGTVRFYGTPAEEKYFGKLYFARAEANSTKPCRIRPTKPFYRKVHLGYQLRKN